ncbi:mitochondrial amidoxime reducing component 2-like [Culicoides brevitarsis]|uniref:mitochondrial amidoxime reducing component 2-like n=1 Tax=Culicoides brevitarsis TaxID=469753 RepID=UPI00307B2816
MSFFLRNRKILLLGAAGFTAGGSFFLYKNRQNCFFNQEWHKIGTVSHLYVYPVKSCSFIEVPEVTATRMGAKTKEISDRVFMIVNEQQELCTARSFPKLVLVKPSVDDGFLRLSAPGMTDFSINLKEISSISSKNDTKVATIWESKVQVIDMGDEAAAWITKVCGVPEKLRLVYYPETTCMRELREKHKIYKEMDKNHIGALQDATSFMLLNDGSLRDLNEKLSKKVTATQFRPNIVIAGAAPYDEDNWNFIKIGEKVVMKSLKPCTRGTFSAVDQKSGEHSKDGEPLKTLNSYRRTKNGGLPVMGVNAGVWQTGEIKQGDDVFVSYKKSENHEKKQKFGSYIFLNNKSEDCG